MGDEYHDMGMVVAQINGHPYEQNIIGKHFRKLIKEFGLRPVVFHSLRHCSTSLKLKLSEGNIKAVQGDTGHAEARMVTDTYAHSFEDDRIQLAKKMNANFFAKVDTALTDSKPDPEAIQQMKMLVQAHPELLIELMNGINGDAETPVNGN